MVTVWLASAATAVSTTPSTGAVYRQPYSSPDGAIVPPYHHDGYMSTVWALARRAACARPLAGASLSMTPPDLVRQIRASHYHAKVTNDIRFNRVIGEFEPDAPDDSPVPVSDTQQRRAVSRSLLTEGLSSTNMSGPFVAYLEHYESTHFYSSVYSSKKTCRKALSAPPFCRGTRRYLRRSACSLPRSPAMRLFSSFKAPFCNVQNVPTQRSVSLQM
jgi:hypothetical protein